MVVQQRQLLGAGGWQVVPELFHRLVMDAVGQGVKENPGQFPVPESVVEAFEPLEFVHDVLRHPALAASGDDLERVGDEAEHALLFKASFQRAKRFSPCSRG